MVTSQVGVVPWRNFIMKNTEICTSLLKVRKGAGRGLEENAIIRHIWMLRLKFRKGRSSSASSFKNITIMGTTAGQKNVYIEHQIPTSPSSAFGEENVLRYTVVHWDTVVEMSQ